MSVSNPAVVANMSRKNGSVRDGRRMMALELTADMLGHAALAAALGVEKRQLRAKLAADRPIHTLDLVAAKEALLASAIEATGLAERIAGLAAEIGADGKTA